MNREAYLYVVALALCALGAMYLRRSTPRNQKCIVVTVVTSLDGKVISEATWAHTSLDRQNAERVGVSSLNSVGAEHYLCRDPGPEGKDTLTRLRPGRGWRMTRGVLLLDDNTQKATLEVVMKPQSNS